MAVRKDSGRQKGDYSSFYCFVLMLLCCVLMLSACAPASPEKTRLELDGVSWDGQAPAGESVPDGEDALTVIVTLDGQTLFELPFGTVHTVRILQLGVGENTLRFSEDAVVMEDADCTGQDCVHMGAVTRENLDYRAMGGFIICLPHKLTVEVRSP